MSDQHAIALIEFSSIAVGTRALDALMKKASVDLLRAGTVQPWLTRPLAVRQRRERLGTSSLLLLMVVTTQHALKEAARVSGLPPSLGSQMWPSHSKGALTTLESLSKKHARPCAQALERVKGLPWTLGLFLASTLQHRASLPPENTPTFQPGNG